MGEVQLVGPIPVQQFFQKFLPTSVSFPKTQRSKLAGFETISTAGLENQLHDEFVRTISILFFVLHL